MAMIRNELLVADAKVRFSNFPEDTLRSLKAICKKGHLVYGPKVSADYYGLQESVYSLEPKSEMDGPFSLVEITALLLIHNEVRQLVSMFAGGKDDRELRKLLGVSDRDIPGEVLSGMSDFVKNMSFAATIRKMVANMTPRPGGTTNKDRNIQYWYDCFASKIIGDGFLLGVGVTNKMVEVVKGLRSRRVINDEGIDRWASYSHGADLAGCLYLAALADSCRGDRI